MGVLEARAKVPARCAQMALDPIESQYKVHMTLPKGSSNSWQGWKEIIAGKDSPTIPAVQRKGILLPRNCCLRAANEGGETLQRWDAGYAVSSGITPGQGADGSIYSCTAREQCVTGLQSRVSLANMSVHCKQSHEEINDTEFEGLLVMP